MARVMVQLARQARKNMTPAEVRLWQCLRNRRLEGRKFLRQKVMGRYRPDFYCAAERLVIELDGSVHDTPEAKANDLERTGWLEAKGLKVIRFRNHSVMNHLPQVLESIKSHFKPLPPKSCTPQGLPS